MLPKVPWKNPSHTQIPGLMESESASIGASGSLGFLRLPGELAKKAAFWHARPGAGPGHLYSTGHTDTTIEN